MESKRNVLIVLGYPIPFPGAGWRRLQYIVNCLSLKGYKLYLLSGISPSRLEVRRHKTYKYIPILRLPVVFSDNLLNKALTMLTFFLFTFLISTILRITIFILSLPPEDPCLGSFLAGYLLRKKIIIDYRDEYGGSISRPILYTGVPFYRMMLLHADKIVAVTNSLLRNLQDNGINREKIVCIPNSADTSIFHPITPLKINNLRRKMGLNFDDFILIYSGILNSDTYNIENILQSIKILVDKGLNNIKLLIAGDGPSKERVLNLAKELGLATHVIYLGVIRNPLELSEIMNSADAGIIPYTKNTLLKNTVPMKFYEYCACAVPVIATAYLDSEIAELITRYKVGLIAKPDDPYDLSAKLEELYRNPVLKSELGKNSRLLIERHYNSGLFCLKYSKIVNIVVSC